MTGSALCFFTPDQVQLLRDRVLELLEVHGVKLDNHAEMFGILAEAGVHVDAGSGMVRFPRPVMERFLDQAPRRVVLGARDTARILDLPRPDGTFYARTATGTHTWLDPETGAYRRLTVRDMVQWARLVDGLPEVSLAPFLFSNDVPVQTADVHGLRTVLGNTAKHVWVQPYSSGSLEYLINLGAAVAGGEAALKQNPVISMIACSLTPRAFKQMDIEVVLRSARLALPIHACSLPSAGGTAPVTLPGAILLAAAEILAMLGMAQAVAPGAPVVACPIAFSMDMRTGRSLQASVEALKCASGAVQFIKAAFGLPTHNYGSGSDAPDAGEQSMSERSVLCMLMASSGSDILGGAGQFEVATAVSPLQLIVDNEIIGMVRQIMTGFTVDDDALAWDALVETKPGDHFLTSQHTLRHCRDAFVPQTFIRLTREAWERQGGHGLAVRARESYRTLVAKDNPRPLSDALAGELDAIVSAADRRLAG